MAVTNFHYITRMSSGFKVYILEGQPNCRSEDRFRHINSDRIQVIPAHPLKRRHNSERGRTLEERRERALSKSLSSAAMRTQGISVPESPTSTWSPTVSPTHLISGSAHSSPVMDEPLALIKKPRREQDKAENTCKESAIGQIQVRPSVITCVASMKSATREEDWCGHSNVLSQHSYDHVEEHFQRSLGLNYQKAPSKQLSISVSVDDHFAKALGEKWIQLKASSSSSASSNTIFLHSASYSLNPTDAHKDSFSPTTTNGSLWSEK